jgi:hypothetical protein
MKFIFTNYNRGLLQRDVYDDLFKGATIGSLPDHPALYINSFDVANHVRFIFSKHYIDTTYYQPASWWGQLMEPQDVTAENDLAFVRVDPNSVKLADAVYASSAYPIAYPNFALRHYGNKILFQGQLIFLADGGLADNSGLVTLLTQMKIGLEKSAKAATVIVIYIDASLDRLERLGSTFQQRGIEKRYAWQNTVIGHAYESIDAAVSMLRDLGWKFVESTGFITDELNANWPMELVSKTANCKMKGKTCWDPLVKAGGLTLRPW